MTTPNWEFIPTNSIVIPVLQRIRSRLLRLIVARQISGGEGEVLGWKLWGGEEKKGGEEEMGDEGQMDGTFLRKKILN